MPTIDTRALRRILIAAGFAVAAAVPGVAHAADAGLNQDLAAARAATARFQDEAAAVAAGYLRTDACVAGPDGVMGYHYVNPAAIGQPLDPARPQVLLYGPRPDGGRQLIGVEYLVFDADQNLATDDDRPTLFGQPFAGPMPGHEPGMPIHYDLHVWVWKHNPSGMFAEFNPTGSC